MDLRPASELMPTPGQPLPLTRTAPPLRRGSMTPRPWSGWWRGLLAAAFGRAEAPLAAAPWAPAAARRRRRLLLLVLACAAFGTAVLEASAPAGARDAWALAQTGLFALLFAWVAAGCVTALMGYRSLLRGDRHALHAADVAGLPIAPDARTAIVMPICNEDIGTVVAGLRATCESLRTAMRHDGAPEVFDVFLLSDSSDPALREVEQAAWQALAATFAAAAGGPAIRVYYRWRQRRTRKKAGNVADFCRRWGRDYRYMVVLDADSAMSGEALLSLVRLMEARPRVGILQTAPRACGHDSLHARVQQFAGRVSGALFSAGLRYWQLGESHYWGHNAILRVEPFMRHCALASLPGKGGLSGAILSHDFVEAALMRRAGYEVWLVPDIEGSFEQPPPHLLDELQRDRRWCQGNLQNARLIAEPGLAPVHRAMFVTGAMSYVASPLWLAFALIGVLPWLAGGAVSAPEDTGTVPTAALLLWGLTLALLFVPRVLAVRLLLRRGEQAAYGGTRKLVASAVLEALLSALMAPVRMLAHSVFVLGALTGLKLQWKSPSREATDVGWREALARFGVSAALAVAVCAWWLAGQPAEAWRVLPMALPLALAVPLAVLTSRRALGLASKRHGWLLTPEESRTPAVLRAAWGPARSDDVAASATPRPVLRGAGVATLAWGGRGAALAGLALAGGVAMVLPRPVATGGLSASDLAALRIVMQAQSPAAAPRVLAQRPLFRFTRVSGGPVVGDPPRARRTVTSI
ncbi:MAG TPA: glucans biosynthesis glucosyltransferase MdoH [Methylibium sp.]|nr:glucans biosynthesis glucosyltransferase MdoH [Methylibium sp.]